MENPQSQNPDDLIHAYNEGYAAGGRHTLEEDYKINLRDQFAGQAMAAMISLNGKHLTRGTEGVPLISKFSYEYADAMIAERNKK